MANKNGLMKIFTDKWPLCNFKVDKTTLHTTNHKNVETYKRGIEGMKHR